ncbi:hypothetical protein [Halodesulfovibrio spirochaetisodalis]|uniref:Uncharacterized protein n=1 Tax=Halodesulfovibrio spirochaetisodalis TaxID=1560234 RepID=A0A1B7XC01_9BACT|nr:hypothetical protein [Halodesulfovibrio spirochaetisodalis]OBQ50294.1 hypothetical protein SP90_10110 [Halodesulfovibrio spirochaetisodalis]
MEHILIKVYGSISNASPELYQAALSFIEEQDEDAVELDGTFFTISFEGIYFMIDEFMDAIKPHLTKECSGRIDYIDVDEWSLTRFWIEGGLVTHNTANLNHVMDHSGH